MPAYGADHRQSCGKQRGDCAIPWPPRGWHGVGCPPRTPFPGCEAGLESLEGVSKRASWHWRRWK
eukprot:3202690-Rhodomonas_salina.1